MKSAADGFFFREMSPLHLISGYPLYLISGYPLYLLSGYPLYLISGYPLYLISGYPLDYLCIYFTCSHFGSRVRVWPFFLGRDGCESFAQGAAHGGWHSSGERSGFELP